MKFIFHHSLQDGLRRKCYFAVCFVTCFLVSLVCLLMKTIVSQGALIFLMLGEKETGEMDFYFSTNVRMRNSSGNTIKDYYYDNAFMNYTKFKEIMEKNEDGDDGFGIGKIWENSDVIHKKNKNDNRKNNKKGYERVGNPFDNSAIRTYFNGATQTGELYLMLFDTEKEREIELGRQYPYEKLKKGECIVHDHLLNKDNRTEFSFHIGMSLFIRNTIIDFYYENDTKISPEIEKVLMLESVVEIKCKVIHVLKEDNFGKETADDDNLIMMESEYFFDYMADFIPKKIQDNFPTYKEKVRKLNAKEYGNILCINFPKNRIKYYIDDDYDHLLENGVKYINQLIKKIGLNNGLNIYMPIIKRMQFYSYGNTLLNLILNVIIISLFGLGLILIYSLLLITTETRSFEFGLLRLIGSSKKHILILVILQSLSFSLPAFICAFLISLAILPSLNSAFRSTLSSDLGLTISGQGFFFALFLNILAPAIAAVIPVRRVLGKNVAESVNTLISQTQGLKIEIISLQKKELMSLIVFGILTVLYGASIYYFLPLSLISLNFGMLGAIFLFIILGILFGFILLSRNVEPLIEKILTNTIFFFKKSYTKMIILKNLTAHRLKNRSSSLMFSLSIGIFIMISVGLDIIMQSSEKMKLMEKGTEIKVYSDKKNLPLYDLYIPLIYLYEKGLISDFSFSSPELSDICQESKVYLQNLGKSIDSKVSLIGTSTGYFNSIPEGLYTINMQNESYKEFSPSEQMYLGTNRGKVGVSAIMNWEFGMDLKDPFFLTVLSEKNEELRFFTKASWQLDSAGGLQMNSQPSYMVQRDAVVSFDTFLNLYEKCMDFFSDDGTEIRAIGYEKTPVNNLNIKPKKDATIEELNEIQYTLRNLSPVGSSFFFYRNMQARIEQISKIVFIIFYCVITIVLIFCSFNLAASMTVSILSQKKEVAVLRSLGMPGNHIIFMFLAESTIIVLSSVVIGTVIGASIAFTMSLQWQVFMYVNIDFRLNFLSILIVAVVGSAGGILGTLAPAKKIVKKGIAEMMRG